MLRTCEPRPTGRAWRKRVVLFHARALVRLLPIHAPRQAVLWTSSRLAPSRITDRSCDLPVEKTRNASNRYLPPNRTACTRTSCVPSSARHFRGGDAPRRLRLRTAHTGGPNVSRRSRPLRRIVVRHNSVLLILRPLELSDVGVFFPRCRRDRASDTPVASSESPSRSPRLPEGCLS